MTLRPAAQVRLLPPEFYRTSHAGSAKSQRILPTRIRNVTLMQCTTFRMLFTFHVSRFTTHVLRITHHASRITSSTTIIPSAIAIAVWREACRLVDADLPRAWISLLVRRAETIYLHDARFRARVRGRGNSGRDYLWSFMRHWISGMIFKCDPALAGRLPRGYEAGRL